MLRRLRKSVKVIKRMVDIYFTWCLKYSNIDPPTKLHSPKLDRKMTVGLTFALFLRKSFVLMMSSAGCIVVSQITRLPSCVDLDTSHDLMN